MARQREATTLIRGVLALGAVLAAAAAATPERAAPERAPGFLATVLSIGDGDSLRVLREGQALTIRLACIDAPELAQAPWGARSRAMLALRLPVGRSVRVIPHSIDRYGRTVAEVISELSIPLVMVEDGQAFAYRRYLAGCNAKEFLDAEYRARRHRYGVWQVPGGLTRPWLFRRRSGLRPDPALFPPDSGAPAAGPHGPPP
ncbi:MAG: thermonuclease family protein [Cyanobacteria bacterium K_Offshore_surface_m2_239]|nr:thermonuclease family protein [Cyanobacteria bacterium K_Offshore_surface_m2_239]